MEKSDHKERLDYPKIDVNFRVSQAVTNGSIGPLPQGIDFEKETEKMWEKLCDNNTQTSNLTKN